MNKRCMLFFAAILLAFLITAPGVAAASKCTYTNVSACDAKLMIEEEDVFILDVCTPTEYDDGHIEGAVLIPLRNLKSDPDALSPDELLPARMKELPCNRNTKILVYCKVGKRGAEASSLLVDACYKDVSNLEGGLTNWVQEGYPIVATYDSWTNVWCLILSPQ